MQFSSTLWIEEEGEEQRFHSTLQKQVVCACEDYLAKTLSVSVVF